MDISIKTSNEIFSLRVAALILKDRQLLLIRNEKFDCFYTVGGGIKEIDFEIQNDTGADRQNEHLYWISIEDLEIINLVPAFLKRAAKNIPDEVTHIISYE